MTLNYSWQFAATFEVVVISSTILGDEHVIKRSARFVQKSHCWWQLTTLDVVYVRDVTSSRMSSKLNRGRKLIVSEF